MCRPPFRLAPRLRITSQSCLKLARPVAEVTQDDSAFIVGLDRKWHSPKAQKITVEFGVCVGSIA